MCGCKALNVYLFRVMCNMFEIDIKLLILGIEVPCVERALTEGEQIRQKVPHCVPVRLSRAGKSRLTSCTEESNIDACLDNRKFIVPFHWTMGHFYCVVRQKIRFQAAQALFFLINNFVPSTFDTIGELYELYKNQCDHLLHISYSEENTFG